MAGRTATLYNKLSSIIAALSCVPTHHRSLSNTCDKTRPSSNETTEAIEHKDYPQSEHLHQTLLSPSGEPNVILETRHRKPTQLQKDTARDIASIGIRAAAAINDHKFDLDSWNFCHPDLTFDTLPSERPYALGEHLAGMKQHAIDDPSFGMAIRSQTIRISDDMQSAEVSEVFDMTDMGNTTMQAVEAQDVLVNGEWRTIKLRATTGLLLYVDSEHKIPYADLLAAQTRPRPTTIIEASGGKVTPAHKQVARQIARIGLAFEVACNTRNFDIKSPPWSTHVRPDWRLYSLGLDTPLALDEYVARMRRHVAQDDSFAITLVSQIIKVSDCLTRAEAYKSYDMVVSWEEQQHTSVSQWVLDGDVWKHSEMRSMTALLMHKDMI